MADTQSQEREARWSRRNMRLITRGLQIISREENVLSRVWTAYPVFIGPLCYAKLGIYLEVEK